MEEKVIHFGKLDNNTDLLVAYSHIQRFPRHFIVEEISSLKFLEFTITESNQLVVSRETMDFVIEDLKRIEEGKK